MADAGKIKIECDECGQQFDVGEELRNRMVECGECQNQFRVNEQSMVKVAKRHFPGEKSGDLSVFAKKIDRLDTSEEVNFRTAAYDQKVDPNAVMPLGPKRVMAIFAGIGLSLVVILIYVLGHDPNEQGGLMLDVTNEQKFVLSGFTALLTALLLIYGCRKNRVVGVVLAVILGGAVLAMPFVYGEYFSPKARAGDRIADRVAEDKGEDIIVYKGNLGYGAVEDAIRRAGNAERVIAVAVIGSKRENEDTIQGFLTRVIQSGDKPRVLSSNRRIGEESADLFLYTNVEISLNDLAKELSALGEVQRVREDLRVIELIADPEKLVMRSAAILQDESSPNFYAANYRELVHPDIERQLAAIKRLGSAKKVGRQADVVDRLKEKLDEISYPYKDDIVKTLLKWSSAERNAVSEVRRITNRQMNLNEDIPTPYVEYLLKFNATDVEPVLLYAWKREPVSMEAIMVESGGKGVKAIVKELPGLDPEYYKSAASILRKAGDESAIPAIERVMRKADEDTKKALKAAIDEIKSRG